MSKLVQITRLTRTEFYNRLSELEKLRNSRIHAPQIPVHELSHTVAGNVVTDSSARVPDCGTCGACCAFALQVAVTPSESEPLPAYWDVTLDDDDVTIRRVLPRDAETSHCVFLKGKVGENISCDIYADRPGVCRDFEAGSDRCHAERRSHGIEPPLNESDVAEALVKLKGKARLQQISDASIQKAAVRTSFDWEGNLLSTTSRLNILAYIDKDDETIYELHQYDPEKETWFENEFSGLSLDEARSMITSRTNAAS